MRKRSTPLEEVTHSYFLHRFDLSPRTALLYRDVFRIAQAGFAARYGRPMTLGDVELNTINECVHERLRISWCQARQMVVAFKSLGRTLAELRILHEDGESVLRHLRVPKGTDGERRALSRNELSHLLTVSRHGVNGVRDHAIVTVLATAGLRLNELLNLRLADLDFRERSIRVQPATSKSRRERFVTMHAEATRALDHYLKDTRAGSTEAESVVFTTRSGQPFTRHGMSTVFRRLKARSGIRDLCAHQLRHSWATYFRRAGSGDLFDLQEEGGWSDLRMVRRYAKGRPLSERRRMPSPLSILGDRQADGRQNRLVVFSSVRRRSRVVSTPA